MRLFIRREKNTAADNSGKTHKSDLKWSFTELLMFHLEETLIFPNSSSEMNINRLICLQAIKGPESNLEKQFCPITQVCTGHNIKR